MLGCVLHLAPRRAPHSLMRLQVLLVRGEGDEEGAPGKWETVDQPDEPPTDLPLAGGALAKVKTDAVGVCGTDFHAFYGKQVRVAPAHPLAARSYTHVRCLRRLSSNTLVSLATSSA